MGTNRRSCPLQSGTNKNRDVRTGPLARPFACSLAPLTRSFALDCSLRSRPPLRSLVCLLAHFTHSLTRVKVNFCCLKMTWFCPIVHCNAIVAFSLIRNPMNLGRVGWSPSVFSFENWGCYSIIYWSRCCDQIRHPGWLKQLVSYLNSCNNIPC